MTPFFVFFHFFLLALASQKPTLTAIIHWITLIAIQTIVELPEFLRKSDKLLSNTERLCIINYLAAHPAAGDIMQGTGGIRKLRWSAQGKGKSGGVRVIYYHHNESILYSY